MPVVELKNIDKFFTGVHALRGINFDVEPGEVHALLGENGAGKSTLIKVLSGVYRPDSGQIIVDGTPRQFGSPSDAKAAGIAAIYQELQLFPELSVAENIFIGHAPRGRFGVVDWKCMRDRARSILETHRAGDIDVTAVVRDLSVGNHQRIEIAKALSQNARVLILDEPTAALTETDVERLFETIDLLRSKGVAIIYISHRLVEVFQIADRVTVLRDGAYVDTKQVAETNQDELIGMMVGRTIDTLFPKLAVTPGEVVFELSHVGRHSIVRDINLQVRRGEIVGFAGLVGSGRSELAQIIFGITPATAGEIRVDGERVSINSPMDAKRLRIAYVPEERGLQGLIRPMRIRENISLATLERLTRWGFIDRAREATLATSTIETFAIRATDCEQVVDNLSGGNQQKVVLGKWLATKPKVLIMDEPTRGIDIGAKSEIHRLMSTLAKEGMAILMISSELPEILGMSDRIVVMRAGQIVTQFDRADADPERVAAAMMIDAPQDRGVAAS